MKQEPIPIQTKLTKLQIDDKIVRLPDGSAVELLFHEFPDGVSIQALAPMAATVTPKQQKSIGFLEQNEVEHITQQITRAF